MQRAYLDAETKVVRLPLLDGPAPARLVINDTHFLFTADFKKSGPDLILTGDDGKKLVIANYFNFEKHPDLVSPDRASNDDYSAPNGLRDLSSPRAAHDRFHLIFQTEFHLLETMLLHLLLHRQMWKSLQFVQLPGVIGVFGS